MIYNVQPVSGSLVATAQIKALSGLGAKGHLHWLYLFNNNGAARFAMVFDKASIPVNGDTMVIGSELSRGANWGDWDSNRNPRGLKKIG